MSRLRHGYTNLTCRVPGGGVEKRYEGTGALQRADREYACLTGLLGVLPVPEVLERDRTVPLLVMRDVAGEHGQDMIDAGSGREVLRLLGAALARLQRVPISALTDLGGDGPVVVHGDFGPQNVLIHDHGITALLDWEFAHAGSPIEDLAWAEWIIRMHHPNHVDTLPELFSSSGLHPPWANRQPAMVDRCADLLRLAEQDGQATTVNLWRERLDVTERWHE